MIPNNEVAVIQEEFINWKIPKSKAEGLSKVLQSTRVEYWEASWYVIDWYKASKDLINK